MSSLGNEAYSSKDGGQNSAPGNRSEPTEPMRRPSLTPSPPTVDRDECYDMLAQVNLLRIRKQYLEAVALCETAVAGWPDRSDAQGLLGDLYQEIGRTDDAILRYCRVLELDPGSKKNRKKMAEAVRSKRKQLGPIAPEKKQYSPRLDRIVRALILSFATLMLLTIMLAPVVIQKRKQEALSASTGTTVNRRIDLSPVILQPVAPQPVTGDEPVGTSTPAPTLIRDPVEEALVELMSEDTFLLQQGIQVLNAEESPLTSGFTITFLDRPTSVLGDSRADILQSCLRVAQSASMRLGSRDTKTLTVRCILLSSPVPAPATGSSVPIEATTTLIFTGDVQRNALPGPDVNLDSQSTAQLEPYFSNVWWGTGST